MRITDDIGVSMVIFERLLLIDLISLSDGSDKVSMTEMLVFIKFMINWIISFFELTKYGYSAIAGIFF